MTSKEIQEKLIPDEAGSDSSTVPIYVDISQDASVVAPEFESDPFYKEDRFMASANLKGKSTHRSTQEPLSPEREPLEGKPRRFTMTRKRLTAATLQSSSRQASGEKAIDLASRLLGRGATDQELVTAGRVLFRGLQARGLNELHALTARVAAESGEDFPVDNDEGPTQPESRDTQKYVAEHELTPDHAVLDVVMNEKTPTQNPTAAKPAAKPAAKANVKKSAQYAAEEDEDFEDFDSEVKPSLEDPEEVEDAEDVYVEDEDLEDEDLEDEDLEDEDLEDEDHEAAESEDFELAEHDEDGHDEDHDEEGDEDEIDLDDVLEEGGDEDDDFTMEDMEDLEALGVDGVLVGSAKKRKASKFDPKPRKASSKKEAFRPSRTRVAAKEGSSDEFEQVFGTPDVSSEFVN